MSQDIERALAMLSVDHHVISPAAALKLISEARKTEKPLATLIQAHIPETDLLRAIADEMGYKFFDMHAREQDLILDERLLRTCDAKVLNEHAAIPVADKQGRVFAALANPLDPDISQYFRSKFPDLAGIALVPRTQVQSRLMYLTNDFSGNPTSPTVVLEYVDYLLQRAAGEGASDIHLRSMYDGSLLVRLRVDGMLSQLPFPLKGREAEVLAALIAKAPTMDSSNQREPQDGTFSFQVAGRAIDARVALIPQLAGSNITVRILDPYTLKRRIEDMGFSADMVSTMRQAIAAPQGCVMVVGPTGSGKSTTLMSLLSEVDAVRRNVLTVEDPVEYRLPYVGQTQIRADLGDRSLTFAKALRSILRQDPDVILVGEIRDSETARTAMDAAITGHTVLSTVHANSAPGSYWRLSEMGVPAFLVTEALTLILSQRLVRQIHECAQLSPPTPEEQQLLNRLGATDITLVPHPVGCVGCAGNGFRGRLAVAELLVPSAELKGLVATGASREEVIAAARRAGWAPIVFDALRLLRAGKTTVTELARVVATEDSDG